jgi:hypothetical protein
VRGLSTGTLNHLVSPHPIKEWVDAVLEEERLLVRLKKISSERTSHELVLRMAGVSRQTLEAALVAATNVQDPESERVRGEEGRPSKNAE